MSKKHDFVAVFPTEKFCEFIFFQNKEEMMKSVNTYPDALCCLIGGGIDAELDIKFPNVFVAVRKK